MAYTKTIWENSPSENTPLSAENFNNIENGIENISNATEYLNGVLGTNADISVNITNTLASGMIIHIIFPTIVSTSDLTFSIDNGTTKKNVQCSGVNVIGTYASGKSLDLTYDGTYWQISDICSLENRITTAEGEIDNLQNGWNSANETWTFVSVDDPTGVITITGDKTTKYSVGMRIKFTNATNVIYGIITAISYSSPNTTLTFLHEIDPTDSLALHLMQNSAITNNYYSSMKVPYGFPMDKAKWSIKKTDVTERVQESPVVGTWYNLGGVNISIPIGNWDISFLVSTYATRVTSGTATYYSTLSTGNNTQSDVELTSYSNPVILFSSGITAFGISNPLCRTKNITLSSKTTYYLNSKTESSTIVNLYNENDKNILFIKAVCAYL